MEPNARLNPFPEFFTESERRDKFRLRRHMISSDKTCRFDNISKLLRNFVLDLQNSPSYPTMYNAFTFWINEDYYKAQGHLLHAQRQIQGKENELHYKKIAFAISRVSVFIASISKKPVTIIQHADNETTKRRFLNLLKSENQQEAIKLTKSFTLDTECYLALSSYYSTKQDKKMAIFYLTRAINSCNFDVDTYKHVVKELHILEEYQKAMDYINSIESHFQKRIDCFNDIKDFIQRKEM